MKSRNHWKGSEKIEKIVAFPRVAKNMVSAGTIVNGTKAHGAVEFPATRTLYNHI